MTFSSKLLSSFSLSAIYSFFRYVHYRQTNTSSGNVENIQSSRAGLKPMQSLQLHWALRRYVWVDYSICQIHLALENSVETPYKFHC